MFLLKKPYNHIIYDKKSNSSQIFSHYITLFLRIYVKTLNQNLRALKSTFKRKILMFIFNLLLLICCSDTLIFRSLNYNIYRIFQDNLYKYQYHQIAQYHF